MVGYGRFMVDGIYPIFQLPVKFLVYGLKSGDLQFSA